MFVRAVFDSFKIIKIMAWPSYAKADSGLMAKADWNASRAYGSRLSFDSDLKILTLGYRFSNWKLYAIFTQASVFAGFKRSTLEYWMLQKLSFCQFGYSIIFLLPCFSIFMLLGISVAASQNILVNKRGFFQSLHYCVIFIWLKWMNVNSS